MMSPYKTGPFRYWLSSPKHTIFVCSRRKSCRDFVHVTLQLLQDRVCSIRLLATGAGLACCALLDFRRALPAPSSPVKSPLTPIQLPSGYRATHPRAGLGRRMTGPAALAL